MTRIGDVIARALDALAPKYELVEGVVVSWRPETAIVQTKEGRVIKATNPLGSKAHRARVLVAISKEKATSKAAIVGVM